MSIIQVGQKVQFDPFKGIVVYGFNHAHKFVTAPVVAVHEEHRMFEVEYDLGDKKQRTAFNFCDIGDTVRICR